MVQVSDAARVTDSDATAAERRARDAADKAYAAARAAYVTRDKADILRAGDLYRYAAALYQKAADAWKARGAARRSFAEHCASMADSLSRSLFARASLAATYQHVGE